MKINSESNVIDFKRRQLEQSEIKYLHIPDRLKHEIIRNSTIMKKIKNIQKY